MLPTALDCTTPRAFTTALILDVRECSAEVDCSITCKNLWSYHSLATEFRLRVMWHPDIWDGAGRNELASIKKVPVDLFWTAFLQYCKIPPERGTLQSDELGAIV